MFMLVNDHRYKILSFSQSNSIISLSSDADWCFLVLFVTYLFITERERSWHIDGKWLHLHYRLLCLCDSPRPSTPTCNELQQRSYGYRRRTKPLSLQIQTLGGNKFLFVKGERSPYWKALSVDVGRVCGSGSWISNSKKGRPTHPPEKLLANHQRRLAKCKGDVLVVCRRLSLWGSL